MSEIINLLLCFTNRAIVIALITRTIYLIKNYIESFKISDEEEDELEKKFEELKKDMDDKLWQLNALVPGIKEWVEEVFEWRIEHSFLSFVIGYIFCLVPIVNLIIALMNLKSILEID
ncbi:hypothetical protein [Clostridium botulinum]|uniref:hypothetical protein n=1 Tax=Clostridium botulinum TaxID=1491 RepID=UPI001967CEC7|nr:hypothetical protein [Clostridium botulinum]MBN1065411.1 hypothetical protein [Clostridium botulinum]